MVGLPDGKKTLRMYNRLDRIPECDGQTDGQTDISPRHSPRYAYASRGKNAKCNVECGYKPHAVADRA